MGRAEAAREPWLRDRRSVRVGVWILIAVLIGGGMWLLRWSGDSSTTSPDTFWYARDALRYSGYPLIAADAGAAEITCGPMARAGVGGMTYGRCMDYRLRLPDESAVRFQRIFTSRPGYALLTTPFVRTMGESGFVVGTALLGIACGVAIALLGLVAGLRPVQALLAEAAFYLLPTGLWASRLLAEAPMMLFLCTALIGAILVISGRRRVAGALTVAISLAVLCAVKPANGMALAAALAAGGLVLLPFTRSRRACLLLSGVSAAVLAGDLGVSAILQLPGLNETLQDTFTVHFRHPDVPAPLTDLHRMIARLGYEHIAPGLLNDPLIPAAILFAVLGLFARVRANAAWLILLTGLSGVVVALAHPMFSQLDRLSVVLWIPVAIGFAALTPRCDRLVTRTGDA